MVEEQHQARHLLELVKLELQDGAGVKVLCRQLELLRGIIVFYLCFRTCAVGEGRTKARSGQGNWGRKGPTSSKSMDDLLAKIFKDVGKRAVTEEYKHTSSMSQNKCSVQRRRELRTSIIGWCNQVDGMHFHHRPEGDNQQQLWVKVALQQQPVITFPKVLVSKPEHNSQTKR